MTAEPTPSPWLPVLLGPPVFLVVLWSVYGVCVRLILGPVEPGSDGDDISLFVPFLCLALVTLGVLVVWLVVVVTFVVQACLKR